MHYKITLEELNKLKAHLKAIKRENTRLKSKSEGVKGRTLSDKFLEKNDDLIYFLDANYLDIKSR